MNKSLPGQREIGLVENLSPRLPRSGFSSHFPRFARLRRSRRLRGSDVPGRAHSLHVPSPPRQSAFLPRRKFPGFFVRLRVLHPFLTRRLINRRQATRAFRDLPLHPPVSSKSRKFVTLNCQSPAQWRNGGPAAGIRHVFRENPDAGRESAEPSCRACRATVTVFPSGALL